MDESKVGWSELWTMAGPLVIWGAMELLKKLDWWNTAGSFWHRIVPAIMAGVWTCGWTGIAVLQATGSWKEGAAVFASAAMGVLIHEIKKGIQAEDKK